MNSDSPLTAWLDFLPETSVAGNLTIVALAVAGWLLSVCIQQRRRVWWCIKNVWAGRPRPSEEYFRVVLCWLENDDDGSSRKLVEQAFRWDVKGFELKYSGRIVKSPGTEEDQMSDMRKCADSILENWEGDLTIVGSIKKDGKEEMTSLWFVPREGISPISLRNIPLPLQELMRRTDLRDAFCAQFTNIALKALAPLIKDQPHNQKRNDELLRVVRRIRNLLKKGGPIHDPKNRAYLYEMVGYAFSILSEWKGDTKYLEQAVDAFNAALREWIPEREPVEWAITKNALGKVLALLGELRGGTEILEQAISTFNAALEVFTREQTPKYLEITQENIKATHRVLRELEADSATADQ